jgi:aryl-alcohol dehydrogenase-like predicted oxidoreductase
VTLFEAIWRSQTADLVEMVRSAPSGAGRYALLLGVDLATADEVPVVRSGSGEWPTMVPMVRDPTRAALQSEALATGMARARQQLDAPFWGAAWSSASDAELGAPDALAAGARLLALPASLLGYGSAQEVGRQAATYGAGIIGLDPMGAGALDGSFLTASPLDRGATARPPSLSELNARLAPITRLGFLTEGKRRTLAQAAVRFVLTLPAVVSVSCDIRSANTLLELAGIERVPPLTPEETDRLSRIGALGP